VRRGHEDATHLSYLGPCHLDDLAPSVAQDGVPVPCAVSISAASTTRFSDQHRTALTDFLRRVGSPQFVQVA